MPALAGQAADSGRVTAAQAMTARDRMQCGVTTLRPDPERRPTGSGGRDYGWTSSGTSMETDSKAPIRRPPVSPATTWCGDADEFALETATR